MQCTVEPLYKGTIRNFGLYRGVSSSQGGGFAHIWDTMTSLLDRLSLGSGVASMRGFHCTTMYLLGTDSPYQKIATRIQSYHTPLAEGKLRAMQNIFVPHSNWNISLPPDAGSNVSVYSSHQSTRANA